MNLSKLIIVAITSSAFAAPARQPASESATSLLPRRPPVATNSDPSTADGWFPSSKWGSPPQRRAAVANPNPKSKRDDGATADSIFWANDSNSEKSNKRDDATADSILAPPAWHHLIPADKLNLKKKASEAIPDNVMIKSRQVWESPIHVRAL
ncbi:hypothetical protein B0T16DRAFT_387854 [Cercophora newfieldiana]|uniref:Uncharacterized protein n=1 Tax=Cercophora newfieldiana TaxID=92897 RepID=A0AA39YHA3_9PEZI|nr:hypothetical protein B0T16DRAFT_387854 [Cercophora newfieldiana]